MHEELITIKLNKETARQFGNVLFQSMVAIKEKERILLSLGVAKPEKTTRKNYEKIVAIGTLILYMDKEYHDKGWCDVHATKCNAKKNRDYVQKEIAVASSALNMTKPPSN